MMGCLNVLDFDLVPAHAERPEDGHLFGELIDQRRLGAVAEGHFAPGFDLMRDLFEQVAMAGVVLFSSSRARTQRLILSARSLFRLMGVCTILCAHYAGTRTPCGRKIRRAGDITFWFWRSHAASPMLIRPASVCRRGRRLTLGVQGRVRMAAPAS